MCKISVIIPVYNSEEWIGRCLRSLLDQSLDKELYEIIVVNDGSQDNSLNIIKKFEENIILINRNQNKGLPYSLNEGISNANGQFIIRVDSDDYVNHEYLKIPFLYLTLNNDIDAVSLDYYEVDERENIISRKNAALDPIGCGIMFRHEQLVKVGLYNPEQKLHEEKELMHRFSAKYSVYNIPLPLYRYRQRIESISNNKKLIEKYGKDFIKSTTEK